MNSVARKIVKNTSFKNIYISPNPGDAGGAIDLLVFILAKI